MDEALPVLATAAGLAGGLYERALVALVEALGQAGDAHWQAWMREDLEIWRTERRTDHHRGAFGGMGSFNDRPLVPDPWTAASIEQLSHITAATASHGPDRFVQVPATWPHPQLSQRWCDTCGRKSVEDSELTRVAADAWSSWAIPRMVTDGTLVARDPYVRHVTARASELTVCAKFGSECPLCRSPHWKHVSTAVF
ncbi:hypothetical protein [Lentzea sp. NPDC051838]|uniref:DUF6966 domain-containing protein n=1 Tax=Lentzea sp. NPDC051838 TaxID=3154849 RepID=UPI00342D4885